MKTIGFHGATIYLPTGARVHKIDPDERGRPRMVLTTPDEMTITFTGSEPVREQHPEKYHMRWMGGGG